MQGSNLLRVRWCFAAEVWKLLCTVKKMLNYLSSLKFHLFKEISVMCFILLLTLIPWWVLKASCGCIILLFMWWISCYLQHKFFPHTAHRILMQYFNAMYPRVLTTLIYIASVRRSREDILTTDLTHNLEVFFFKKQSCHLLERLGKEYEINLQVMLARMLLSFKLEITWKLKFIRLFPHIWKLSLTSNYGTVKDRRQPKISQIRQKLLLSWKSSRA